MYMAPGGSAVDPMTGETITRPTNPPRTMAGIAPGEYKQGHGPSGPLGRGKGGQRPTKGGQRPAPRPGGPRGKGGQQPTKGGQRPVGGGLLNPGGQKRQLEQWQSQMRNKIGKGGQRPTSSIPRPRNPYHRVDGRVPAPGSPMASKLSKEAQNLLKAVPNKKAYNKLTKLEKSTFNKAAKKYGFPMKNIKK